MQSVNTSKGIEDYSSLLRELDISFTYDSIWVYVNFGSLPTQGWKLHLSAIIKDAPKLLLSVVPYLREHKLNFKFAKNKILLDQLNSGYFGQQQIGKFITIYPLTSEDSFEHARAIKEITTGFQGPAILTDLKLGNILYSRYGAYNPILVRSNNGIIEKFIVSNEGGNLVKDEYEIPYKPLAHPFSPLIKFEASSKPDSLEQLISREYFIISKLKSRPKGSSFLAVKLKDRMSTVIKFGRKHHLSDSLGRDAADRAHHEFRILKKLKGIVGTPKAIDFLKSDAGAVLVTDFKSGLTVESIPLKPFKERNVDDKKSLIKTLHNLTCLIAQLHTREIIHRDLTLANIVLNESGKPSLIDFELSFHLDEDAIPYSLGTHGYMSPQQEKGLTPCYKDDVYSLGVIIFVLICGCGVRHIHFLNKMEEDKKLKRFKKLTSLPAAVVERLLRCLHTDPKGRPTVDEVYNTISLIPVL